MSQYSASNSYAKISVYRIGSLKAIFLHQLIVFLICIVSLSSALSKPSFNCDKAKKVDEFAICDNAELSRLDVEATNEYKKLRTVIGKDKAEKIAGAQLKERASCGGDTTCIRNAITNSINVYKGYLGQDENLTTETINDASTNITQYNTPNAPPTLSSLPTIVFKVINSIIINAKSKIATAPDADQNRYTVIALLLLLFISSTISTMFVNISDSLSNTTLADF